MKHSRTKPKFIHILLISGMVGFFSCTTQDQSSEMSLNTEENEPGYRDIYPDTWVATDALGREMPSFDEVGPPRTDKRRVSGIFYITWHTPDKHNPEEVFSADVSKILAEAPEARLDSDHPLWYTDSYHWGEPEMGYFLSQDRWMIRKDISMLSDAGVDVLVMDVTNAVRYWEEWDVIFKVMLEMRTEGNKVPQFCFWAFNGPVITVVQDLYERVYKEEKYRDLWFHWDGKPLLLYNGNPSLDANRGGIKHRNPNYDPMAASDPDHPHYLDPDYTEKFYKDYTREVKDFFTTRTMWWGYYEWAGERFVGTEDNWSFGYSLAEKRVKALPPDSLLSTHKGILEQAAVTAAQHPVSMSAENMGVGKSWTREAGQPPLDEYDMPERTWVPWLGDSVDNPTDYGIYFQDRWDEAIASDPEFLYINDWNEWTAGKYHVRPEGGITREHTGHSAPWLGRDNPFIFVDQYNAEFNRCIHPMKGGHTDNYYMQMAQNLRKYKGVRSIPENKGKQRIVVDGSFDDWKNVDVEYRDSYGDVVHRDHHGYGNLHYTDASGRNDILTAKVGISRRQLCFYAECADPLSPMTDTNWMLLLIDADQDATTGWFGYDYLVNQEVEDAEHTSLMEYDQKTGQWKNSANLEMAVEGNKLEIAIPMHLMGLSGSEISFDFKWADNPEQLKDPISFCTHGDTAPNRRFNYRFIWEK